MNSRKMFRIGLGVIIAAAFIWLISRHISLKELHSAFGGTDLVWITAGFLAFAVGYSCRIERWRLMLLRENQELSWGRCAGPLLASFAANNVLPFRAGDVLRAFAFNDRLGVSSGIVVATLFVERLLDLLMVLILLGAALTLFGLDAGNFAGVGGTTLLLATLVILFLLLYPRLLSRFLLSVSGLAAHLAPRLGHRLRHEVEKSLATLEHLAQGRNMVRLVAWSLLAWLAEGAVFWCAGLALASIAKPLAAWLALPVGTLATLIPSTPGYVGTFDYFTVRAMLALDNAVTAATAYALLVHAMLWLPPTLLGGLYLLLHPAHPVTRKNLSS